jgi:hypothetical protein
VGQRSPTWTVRATLARRVAQRPRRGSNRLTVTTSPPSAGRRRPTIFTFPGRARLRGEADSVLTVGVPPWPPVN